MLQFKCHNHRSLKDITKPMVHSHFVAEENKKDLNMRIAVQSSPRSLSVCSETFFWTFSAASVPWARPLAAPTFN